MTAINTKRLHEFIHNKSAGKKEGSESDLMLCIQDGEVLKDDERKRLIDNIGTVLYNLKQELITIGDIKKRIPEDKIISISNLKLPIAELLYIALD